MQTVCSNGQNNVSVTSLILSPVLILEATYPIKKHYHWHPRPTPSTTTAATIATTVTTTTLFHPYVSPPPGNSYQVQHHQFVTSGGGHEAEMVG